MGFMEAAEDHEETIGKRDFKLRRIAVFVESQSRR